MSSERDHALSLLSEEERKAIEEPIEDAADADLDGEAGEDEDDEADDGVDGAQGADADDGDPEGDEGDPGEDEPATAAAAPAGPVETPSALPTYSFKLPDDFDDRVTALEGKFDALETEYSGGDMSPETYRKELRALTREQSELDGMKQRAEIAEDMNRQTAEHQAKIEQASWEASVLELCAFALKPENGGLDYEKDENLAKQLIAQTKALQESPGKADKSKQWLLQEAHRVVMFLNGKAAPGAAPAPAPAAPAASAKEAKAKKAEMAAARKPDLAKAAKSLGDVAGTTHPGDVSGNEFAHLDGLEGDAFASAYSKLTPAQRDAYRMAA